MDEKIVFQPFIGKPLVYWFLANGKNPPGGIYLPREIFYELKNQTYDLNAWNLRWYDSKEEAVADLEQAIIKISDRKGE